MTISKDRLRELHEATTIVGKQALVDAEGRNDSAPKLSVHFKDGCHYAGMPTRGTIAAIENMPDERWWIGSVAAATTHAVWVEHGKTEINSVVWVSEGYARTYEKDEGPHEDYEHGDFAKEFAREPDTDVTEMIATHYFEKEDGEWHLSSYVTFFHYTDGGLIVFGESTFSPPSDKPVGRLYDHFTAVLKECT